MGQKIKDGRRCPGGSEKMTVVWPTAATTKATLPPAYKGGKMKKEKIKPLPVVKKFVGYIVRRAQRVLGLKNADFDHASIDVLPDRGTIWVWFHNPDKVIGRVQLYFDGRCYDKLDNRLDEDK